MSLHFDLYYEDGFAYLFIEKGATPPFVEDIINRMNLLGIPPLRAPIIEQFIEQAQGTGVKLCPWMGGAHLAPKIRVEISENQMDGFVIISPPKPGGGFLTYKMIISSLTTKGILQKNYLKKSIETLVENPIYNKKILVAQGLNPQEAIGKQVKLAFSDLRGKPFKKDRYGRMDLRDLNFIQLAIEGQILGKIIPRVEPIDGYTLFGESIIADKEIKDQSLELGNGVILENDTFIATEKGNISFEKGILSIEPIVILDKVDYKTGHIYFDGSVLVKDRVADGFKIEATGDIQIDKTLGRVSLKAGRSIVLKGGITGDSQGTLEAEGSIYAHFIERATIKVGQNLFVDKAIMDSRVYVGGYLLLGDSRSEITGGHCFVKQWIKCKKIGNLYGIPTRLMVGVDPYLFESYFFLLKKKQGLVKEESTLLKTMEYLKEHHNQVKYDRDKLIQKKELAERSLIKLKQEEEELIKSLEPQSEAMILVEDFLYEGVTISFGLYEPRFFDKVLRKTIFLYEGGHIVEKGYNPAKLPQKVLDIIK